MLTPELMPGPDVPIENLPGNPADFGQRVECRTATGNAKGNGNEHAPARAFGNEAAT
jgi:hypothetical protein